MTGTRRPRPLVIGIIIVPAGLAFLAGGIWLVVLGGSWYYLVAGVGLVLSGAFLIAGRWPGLWLYAAVLLGTLAWSLAEVGLAGWELEPRLFLPALVGLYLLMPWVTRKLELRGGRWGLGLVVVACGVVGVIAFLQPRGIQASAAATRMAGRSAPAGASASASTHLVPANEWRFYGRTPRGDRYSPLTQINRENIGKLQLAWKAETGDTANPGENVPGGSGPEFNFEDTPIEVDGTLYVCTGHSWVVAFDAATGQKKWTFNPHAKTDPDEYLACRGVAYYEAPPGTPTDCPRRIIAPVLDARMVALNADTGKPCRDFGNDGFIDMTRFLGRVPPGFHYITSTPLVLDGRLITGGWIHDNQSVDEPSGAVRAYDPITGKLIWAWDMGRANSVVHRDDLAGSQLTRGTPNAWGAYTADP